MMHFEGYSQREICAALKCGHSRVSRLIAEACKSGIRKEAVKDAPDADIARLLTPPSKKPNANYAKPDFERLSKELEKPDVTRKLLWYEYCTDISDDRLVPYQYSQFCNQFDEHLRVNKATYRIKHEPGKRMFVDWAGSVGHIIDAVTGTVSDVYVFVACLPYSAMFYAEGFMDMKQAAWTAAHIRAIEYFGGAPAIFVPDNATTAVVRTPVYVTLVNDRYDDLARHYGCAVIPARIKKSNDKALVENAVNIVEKSILAAIRNIKFFTLDELNDEIWQRVDKINAASFQLRPGSRREVFEAEEKGHLKPLPPCRFELATYKTVKVYPDYHVQIDSMRYSVPYRFIGKICEARITTDKITVMYGKETIASHRRLYGSKGQCSTRPEHMPKKHADYDAEWTPGRYQRWADTIGPATRNVIDRILGGKQIVEQAFLPCMNVLGLAKKGRRELLEEACASAIETDQVPTYSLIKNTMEAIKTKRRFSSVSKPVSPEECEDTLGGAGYVRGSDYYHIKKEGKDDF
ncbi:MAG: IS21 family transposase [Clostridiales bacterium]|nr:IS21 family transposase [Clostridiales bacterium]